MYSLNIRNIKAEKANAIKKHRLLQKIASLFRLIEICLVLALFSRFSTLVPTSVKNSSDYFKDLTITLVSPGFVFILGNVIVITLFVKSGQDSNAKNSRNDLYQEFLEKSDKNHILHRYETEENRENRGNHSNAAEKIITVDTCTSSESRNCQRSQSENFRKPNCKKSCPELRRSVTEKGKGSSDFDGKGWVKKSFPEDHMSNEEFRCTVEAFIARQKRFTRDEENSIIID